MAALGYTLDKIDEALAVLDEINDEKAQGFVESVEKKLNGIRSWIDTNERVTDKQQQAVENMLAGARKWLGSDDDEPEASF